MFTDFFEMVKFWTVSDYKTPGIKAEVILDMLITDFIGDLLTHHFKEKVTLLTKEFPIRINTSNLNAKVDYLVSVGKKKLVLVELKTTNDSYSDPQKHRMEKAVEKGAKDLIKFYEEVADLKTLSASAGKKYNYSRKMYMDNLKNNGLAESNFSELDYMYILLTDSKDVPDDKKLILADHFDNADFSNSLSENRRELWGNVRDILKSCANCFKKES